MYTYYLTDEILYIYTMYDRIYLYEYILYIDIYLYMSPIYLSLYLRFSNIPVYTQMHI